LDYCYHCVLGVHDCFGCISLRKTQYRIFNKQYNKEDYETLKKKIIEHMKKTGEYGRFFPVAMSHYAYNESTAHMNFPLTPEVACKKGYTWREKEMPQVPQDKRFPAPGAVWPETIAETPQDVTDKFLFCSKTHKPFRVVKPEYAFYKKYNIPLPQLHPDERFSALYKNLGPFVSGKRTCSQCAGAITTVYTDPAQTVLCDDCYTKTTV